MSADASLDFFMHTDALDSSHLSLADEREGSLVDVLDRLLDRGVVIYGDLRISVADVDLLFVGLKVFVASIDTMEQTREASIAAARAAARDALHQSDAAVWEPAA